ncbi:MAG: hypothetical protein JW753_04755 [Dehalococcoidia bacterium]|nr:hypothetical protein [Dehalococcoidia bacterium]
MLANVVSLCQNGRTTPQIGGSWIRGHRLALTKSPAIRGAVTALKQMTSARTCCAVLCLAVLAVAAIAACSLTAAAPAGDLIRIALPESDVAVFLDANGVAAFDGTGIQYIGQTGQPSLPCQSIRVLLPPDADLSTVEASITGQKWTEIDGEWDIAPVGRFAVGDGADTGAASLAEEAIGVRDAGIYESDALFPTEPVCKVDVQVMRGWNMAQVLYAPLACNPVEKRVYELSGNAMEITYERTALKTASAGIDLTAADQIQEMTVNFAGMAGEYGGYAVSADTGRYVIITTSAIQAASSSLMDFVASKEARGFTVQVATEGTWGGGTGDTAAENLRAWLQANYVSLDIEYVLLIGNPNPNSNSVPMKMCYPQDYDTDDSDCPTDFYYAELTSDWDTDIDGLYGEYDDDFAGNPPRAAEVAVGRIPYYGSITDLDGILSKIIDYENAPASAVSWRENVLLPMEPSDVLTPGYQLGEEIKDDVLPVSWTYHRVYEEDYGLNPVPETTPCDEDGVTNAWNGSDFGAIFWWTHGSSTTAVDVMDLSHAATLDDDHPGFTFQCSCTNGMPEVTNNLGYSLLKNGCIATVSASRISWYMEGQTSFAGTPTNSGMTFEYASRLISSKMYAGDALNGLKADISPYHEVLWMNYLDFNVYGCPAVGLFNSAPDQAAPSVVTYYAESVTTTSAQLRANLTSLGTADNVTVSFQFGTTSGSYSEETEADVKDTIGTFFFDLGSLDPAETYYYRAKAAGNGTTYGLEKSFTTLSTPPTVTTSGASDVATNSARLNGNLSSLGTAANVSVSFQWGTTSEDYDYETTPATVMIGNGTFYFDLGSLAPGTYYYYRAKAVGHGTVYGTEESFTTLTTPPSVTTDAASSVTATSATLNGTLGDMGTAGSVTVSFEWGTVDGGPYPNTETVSTPMIAPGTFSAPLNGLDSDTTYYYRAMAVGDGSDEGGQVSFSTLTVPPSVTTDEASNVTISGARLNGTLQSRGTADSVSVSFEWGTSSGSYTSFTTDNVMPSTGPFYVDLSGLADNTTFYYRAKAVGDGTSYGEEQTFKTGTVPPSVTTGSAVNISTTSATLTGTLDDLGTATSVNVYFLWGTNAGGPYPNPTASQPMYSIGAFSADLSGLTPSTTYYFVARTMGDGAHQGTQMSFTTLEAPVVTTGNASDVSGTSATLHGDLTDMGSAATVSVSFEWGIAPGVYDNVTTVEVKDIPGAFEFSLTDLSPGTTYYYRAKAEGDGGAVYGGEQSFTTFQTPEVSSVAPGSGSPGQGLTVIITGTGFTGATAVSFGADIVVDSFTVVGATSISAAIHIPCDGTPGTRGVLVTTPGGTDSLSDSFTVSASAPDRPQNASPANDADITTLTPTLSASAFSHLCSLSHVFSQWQVTDKSGDYSDPLDDTIVVGGDLTSFTLPMGVIGSPQQYWWRVRYQDDRGAWSDWSEETSFHRPDFIRAELNGSAEIRVYDSTSGVTGSVDGEEREEIADSEYVDGNVALVSPTGGYRYEVVGTGDGSYTLVVTRAVGNKSVVFRAEGIPVSAGEVHQYVVDWDALSRGVSGVTISIDSDGDGAFDKTVLMDGKIDAKGFAAATKDPEIPFWLWILVAVSVVAGITTLLVLLRADRRKKQTAGAA